MTRGGYNFTFHPSSIPGKRFLPFLRELKFNSALKCRAVILTLPLTLPLIKGYPEPQQERWELTAQEEPESWGTRGGWGNFSILPTPDLGSWGLPA